MTKQPKDKNTNKMWGGRFDAAPSDIMMQINSVIHIDKRLYSQDIRGSIAHCEMLAKQEIISKEDGVLIIEGLYKVKEEIENGQFNFKPELEDIHMNIESRLKEIIGDVAGKLHTARSRNDQVVTDFKMWVRDAIDSLINEIEKLQSTIKKISNDNSETIMPGFTHLQVAQPITLSMHLMAYHDMLERDKTRFIDCNNRLNKCPLGACALAGTSFNTDRDYTAKKLGFYAPVSNTLDAISSRDFALEFLSATNICAINLSRLSEEIILWSTSQFNFIRLCDSYSTGSSIMPQKKNPDAAELVRAKSGRINGNLQQLSMIMKALPLAYNKDMQEDKEATFESFDIITLCLRAMDGMLSGMKVNKERMLEDAKSGYSTATEIADWLVRNLDMPFRDAHHVTGQIVKMAEKQGKRLDELLLTDMQSIEPKISEDIFNYLDVKKVIENKPSFTER